MSSFFGIILALACALTTNVGFLYKHRGACAAPSVNIRRPLQSAKGLFASPLFTIGWLIGAGALLILGPHVGAPEEHHGYMLGAASGILFGVSDVAIKAISGIVSASGAWGLLTPWTFVCVAASVAAFYSSAKGLQDGDAVPVIAVTG